MDLVMKQRKKIAVIGSGISGLSSAWFLGQHHDVTLFEKNERLGGHTHSVWVEDDSQTQSGFYVDTGFIVFNRPNYPNLTQMFKHLDVETVETDMSFGVSINQGALEYAGSNLNTLFAQRKNILKLAHWKMIREILRFNRLAKTSLENDTLPDVSLGEFLDQHGFSDELRSNYLLPMAAAIWSCPTDTMQAFPVISFLRFFENHGLLNIEDRPQWETVAGGSINYLEKILAQEAFEVRANQDVVKIDASEEGCVRILSNEDWLTFDEVVLACHGDESWQMLDQQDAVFERLKNFEYQTNIAYLHCDKRLMPINKRAWSSWNYLSETAEESQSVAVSYWMNLLQPLPSNKDYFVSLNPPHEPENYLKKIVYQHPVFDTAAVNAQSEIMANQGHKGVWFVGSYLGNGFHEDGLRSAVQLAAKWQIALPWQQATSSGDA